MMSSFDLCGNHHAIEQASRRCVEDDVLIQHTRRKILISTQAGTPRRATKRTGCGGGGFACDVSVGNTHVGRGVGPRKVLAKENAAENALRALAGGSH